jgi:hypothetical protein
MRNADRSSIGTHKKKKHLGDRVINGTTILKWILKKKGVMMKAAVIWFSIRSGSGLL